MLFYLVALSIFVLPAAGAELRIECGMDDSVYVEGAPIPVAVRITNKANRAIAIPPADPAYGYVGFILESAAGVIPPTMGEPPGVLHRALRLEPSGVETYIIDLVRFYGISRNTPGTLDHSVSARSLPVGKYSAKILFMPALARVGPPLESRPVEFTVIALGQQPREAALVADLISGLPRPGNFPARAAYCRAQIDRFRDSQFLPTVYLLTGSLMRTVRPEYIAYKVMPGKRISNCRAALLQQRCHVEHAKREDKLRWLSGVTALHLDSLSQAVVTSWQRKVAQGVFDYSR
ncbi:MAG TPA: hypothetical protein VL503_04845 [Candidatus Omnitrophota bacterium]|nr:hypothetical protein [Candidatus Omnitrophota bacterium]